MRTIFAVALLPLFAPSFIHAQSPDFRFGVRMGAGIHAAGFELSSDHYSWRHQMHATFAVGATLWTPIVNGRWGARVDADYLRRVQFDSDPGGPQLTAGDDGYIRSVTASVSAVTIPSCHAFCLDVSAGYGVGWFDFRQQELRGDIVNQVAAPQTAGVFRIGLDGRSPRISRNVSAFIADYIVKLDPAYSGERLSAMHLVYVGIGISN